MPFWDCNHTNGDIFGFILDRFCIDFKLYGDFRMLLDAWFSLQYVCSSSLLVLSDVVATTCGEGTDWQQKRYDVEDVKRAVHKQTTADSSELPSMGKEKG